MTEDGVTETMKPEEIKMKKTEEGRGRKRLRERGKGGEGRGREEVLVKVVVFVCFILTVGFGTSLPVSKMINIEDYDIEVL